MVSTEQVGGILSSAWSKLRTVQGALLVVLALFLVYVGFSGLPSLDSLNAFFNTSLGGSPTGAVVLKPLNGNVSSELNQSSGENVSSGPEGNVTAILAGPADLAVTSLSYSPSEPVEGDTVSVTAKISNLGDASAVLDNVSVSLSVEGFTVSTKSIDLTGKPEADVSFAWTAVKGSHDLVVSVDPLSRITDEDRANNQMSKGINVSVSNHPPVIQPIADISVTAGDRAIITVNASDPDNDPLAYYTNDSRFVQSGNTFAWRTTDYNDGTYRVLVSVSDGSFTDTTGVTITVNPSGGGGGYQFQSVALTTVDGYVTDLTASFIPGANVTGLCLGNSNSFSAVTDSSGRYSGMFECPFNTTINVSATKNNFTGTASNSSDLSGHAAIDVVLPFSNAQIPEFPSAAVPVLLSIASFGLVRLRKR